MSNWSQCVDASYRQCIPPKAVHVIITFFNYLCVRLGHQASQLYINQCNHSLLILHNKSYKVDTLIFICLTPNPLELLLDIYTSNMTEP